MRNHWQPPGLQQSHRPGALQNFGRLDVLVNNVGVNDFSAGPERGTPERFVASPGTKFSALLRHWVMTKASPPWAIRMGFKRQHQPE